MTGSFVECPRLLPLVIAIQGINEIEVLYLLYLTYLRRLGCLGKITFDSRAARKSSQAF